MKTSDFYFDLPDRLIAQHPLADRSASRLLRLDRATGDTSHGQFRDLIDELNAGDCLVLNETKVLPARLKGIRKTQGGGAGVELLLLRRLEDSDRWEALAYPGRKVRPGDILLFGGERGGLRAKVESVKPDGNRIVSFEYDGIFEQRLEELGEMPLPPYIKERLNDGGRYQTVYAKNEGSAAAPTAGLHFTQKLLGSLSAKGVVIARITLHVGLGTFRPVKAEDISGHEMHSEFYNIEPEQAEAINGVKRAGGRVIAVGTTVCRTLEARTEGGVLLAGSGETNIFIYPGYEFKLTDGLVTNFHLPGSTLIMLVSALAGRERTLRAYREAVEREYRFYSFGDAMLIV